MKNSMRFSLILLSSVIFGAILGLLIGPKAEALKPLGDLFLNLLFTAVTPLVFFSISSAVSSSQNIKEFGSIAGAMLWIFILTGIIASIVMIIGVSIFPPTITETLKLANPEISQNSSFLSSVTKALSVSDFPMLFSKNNMLALIVFAILTGIATSLAAEKGIAFKNFLVSGNEVMLKIIQLIMFYAPIGLAAYFAYLVGVLGPQLLGPYFRAIMLYYPLAFLYFFFAFSFYVWIAGKKEGVRNFWKNILPVALTSLGTGSSVATIPANLQAADNQGIPRKISEIVIPLGSTIHMDGSCLSAILKIALLFQVYDLSFTGLENFVAAIGIALLAGTVMSGIPGGGFIGEIMIVSFYGFPPEALPLITTLGMLVDPPATMVNATGDNVASLLVHRFLNKK